MNGVNNVKPLDIDKNSTTKKAVTVSPRHPDSRLQAEWLFLYQQLPPNQWRTADYSTKTKSWLNGHNGIRQRQATIVQLSLEYRIGALNWDNYKIQIAPRIYEHIHKLHQHHTIEDNRYFPDFIHCYPQLEKGFALLENDHVRLNRLLDELQRMNMLLIKSNSENKALAEDLHSALVDASDFLSQHLTDEEDLVIPILGLRQS